MIGPNKNNTRRPPTAEYVKKGNGSDANKKDGFSFKSVKEFFTKSNFPLYLMMGGFLFYGWFKITLLESRNESLSAANELANERIESITVDYNTLADDVDRYKNDISEDLKMQREITKELNRIDTENRQRVSELRSLFNRSSSGEERNMDDIANNKALLLERRVNDATHDIGLRIQELTTNKANTIGDDPRD